MRTKFSAVVIAKNEGHIIQRCISALSLVTEDIIIVVDDSTTDNTAQLSKAAGAQVFVRPWEGYSANKNFGVSQANNDWIICVDADEILDQKLIDSLNSLDAKDDCVYEMNIQTFFGSYPVRHCGWFPDWNIRLFNKQVMSWNGNYVHEKLTSTIALQHTRLPGLIQHYSFIDEVDMVTKFDNYARLRAAEWEKAGKTPSLLKRLFGPQFRFFKTYILNRGFLDGKVGYTIAKNEYILKQKEQQYFYQNNIGKPGV